MSFTVGNMSEDGGGWGEFAGEKKKKSVIHKIIGGKIATARMRGSWRELLPLLDKLNYNNNRTFTLRKKAMNRDFR